MSGVALHWAMENLAPKCPTGNHIAVLVVVGHHMGIDGRGCWASLDTIAKEAKVSRSTVKRVMADFRTWGFIIPGDWQKVSWLRSDRRPDVWDFPMDGNVLTTVHSEPPSNNSTLTRDHTDPSSASTDRDNPSQPINDGSINALTTVQTITSRGFTVNPKPVSTKPVKEEPLGAARSAARGPAAASDEIAAEDSASGGAAADAADAKLIIPEEDPEAIDQQYPTMPRRAECNRYIELTWDLPEGEVTGAILKLHEKRPKMWLWAYNTMCEKAGLPKLPPGHREYQPAPTPGHERLVYEKALRLSSKNTAWESFLIEPLDALKNPDRPPQAA